AVLQLQGDRAAVSRVLYCDCCSGIAGDMTLGALVDAGLPFADLQRALGSLALGDAHVHAHKVLRAGVSATKFSVHEHAHGGASHEHAHHDHAGHHGHDHAHHEPGGPGDAHAPHRSLAEIFTLI